MHASSVSTAGNTFPSAFLSALRSVTRRIRWHPLSTLLILALLPAWACASVIQCAGPDGAVVYTQFHCPPNTTPRPFDRDGGILSVVTTPALSEAERRALTRLEAGLEKARRQRHRESNQRNRALQQQQRQADARCREALSALDQLAVARRQGYSADQDRRYDAEEKRWRQQKRSAC